MSTAAPAAGAAGKDGAKTPILRPAAPTPMFPSIDGGGGGGPKSPKTAAAVAVSRSASASAGTLEQRFQVRFILASSATSPPLPTSFPTNHSLFRWIPSSFPSPQKNQAMQAKRLKDQELLMHQHMYIEQQDLDLQTVQTKNADMVSCSLLLLSATPPQFVGRLWRSSHR
jgi:hypothetical protein